MARLLVEGGKLLPRGRDNGGNIAVGKDWERVKGLQGVTGRQWKPDLRFHIDDLVRN